jgi:ribosome-associated toxin RatA of RatAB toxin-antitoxin module
MKAIRIEEAIIIEENPELIFNFTQDYSKRLQWDTFLKRADLMDGVSKAAKGAKAYCAAKNGLAMVTEYVTFNRPEVTAIKMIKGPIMFKTFSGSWRFRTKTPETTEVIFIYSFALRFPFALLSGYINRNLKKNVRQRLVDLKHSIEQLR